MSVTSAASFLAVPVLGVSMCLLPARPLSTSPILSQLGGSPGYRVQTHSLEGSTKLDSYFLLWGTQPRPHPQSTSCSPACPSTQPVLAAVTPLILSHLDTRHLSEQAHVHSEPGPPTPESPSLVWALTRPCRRSCQFVVSSILRGLPPCP